MSRRAHHAELDFGSLRSGRRELRRWQKDAKPNPREGTGLAEFPAELDALTAAPANDRLLLENDLVRVLETVVAVGASTPVHTHRWASVEYVLSATDFVRHDSGGNVLFDTRVGGAELQASEAVWAEPFPPHSVENVGHAELRVIMVELKEHT